MNKKFKLQIQVALFDEYGASTNIAYQNLDVSDLTFFQVCTILGGLQVLIDDTMERK